MMPFRPALAALLTCTAALLPHPALAVDPARAEEIVQGKCFICHGAAGESSSPVFPRLAGQNAGYVARQLSDYRTGKRKSTTMQPMVEDLTPADFQALGAYFAKVVGTSVRHLAQDSGLQDGALLARAAQVGVQVVVVALEILLALGLRNFNPSVTACPGCGRTTSTTFQELAKQIDDFLRAQMPVWRERYPGVESMKVAVMGCIVNGPGESKHADIGISLPGTGENPAAPVFIDGQKALTLRGPKIAEDFEALVLDYIEKRFGRGKVAAE